MQQKTEWTEEDWQNLKLSDNFLFGYVMQNDARIKIVQTKTRKRDTMRERKKK